MPKTQDAAALAEMPAEPVQPFREDTFRGVITHALRSGYSFQRLDRAVDAAERATPLIRLRHDVDISPIMALRLGEIEHEHGVAGNFFFQLNAETYSFLVPGTLAIIRRLREMGHCVGVHIDETLVGREEPAIASTLDWVAGQIVGIDRAVSFHRPSPQVLGRRYQRFVSAYDDRVFDPDSYLSDSRRSMAFHRTVMAWIDDRRPCLQLLLHPEWWCGVDSLEQFWDMLRARRTAELRHYMIRNFPNVFSPILAEEQRTFGL
ncbi:hypothetical protein [Arenibaculum pallidiluteum]|uniref:hypothetical protein n=1 Tax=Arenibaculum pallidiluteum TaxID=2812559 RepID=UPI001A976890|nr:hypothetical protein [Arenibaculum pallidiluteum]